MKAEVKIKNKIKIIKADIRSCDNGTICFKCPELYTVIKTLKWVLNDEN